tara:strand:+ start:1861 stop:2643 length:783 start_codon:yes stop_codon:yes gene_type:complete
VSEIRKITVEQGCLTYGSETIHYDVVRKNSALNPRHKTTKQQVVIKVHSDRRVVATAPEHTSKEAIQEAVNKRAKWIWKHMTTFSSLKEHVLPRQYVSGESQFYLGRRYMLKILIESQYAPSVKLLRGKLVVSLSGSNSDSSAVKALIDKWYVNRAKIIFNERLQLMLVKATWVTKEPHFKVMSMKKQWGSCSAKGNLVLNPHLVKASKESIDYVILHELCHIAEHNHSDRFWRLLTEVMPNWKQIKSTLDTQAELYLNK